MFEIRDREWRVERGKKKERQGFQSEEVEKAIVGEIIEDGRRFWFMEEEAVIHVREVIDREGGDKVKLRPGESPPD